MGYRKGQFLDHCFLALDLITVSNKLHFIMYADDITIYFNLEDFNQGNLENEVNNELSRVSEWMTLNKLSLNASKTKSMTFHRAQKKLIN